MIVLQLNWIQMSQSSIQSRNILNNQLAVISVFNSSMSHWSSLLQLLLVFITLG